MGSKVTYNYTFFVETLLRSLLFSYLTKIVRSSSSHCCCYCNFLFTIPVPSFSLFEFRAVRENEKVPVPRPKVKGVLALLAFARNAGSRLFWRYDLNVTRGGACIFSIAPALQKKILYAQRGWFLKKLLAAKCGADNHNLDFKLFCIFRTEKNSSEILYFSSTIPIWNNSSTVFWHFTKTVAIPFKKSHFRGLSFFFPANRISNVFWYRP